MKHAKPKRSIAKSITWRFCATVATIILVWIFTGKLTVAFIVGGIEVVVKMIIYYLHERVWSFINFGKKVHPLSSLPVNKPLTEEDMEEVKKKLRDLGYLDED